MQENRLGKEILTKTLADGRNPMRDPYGAESLQGTHTPDVAHEMGLTIGQLNFYEQLHAHGLNKLLEENKLAFTFRTEELKSMQPEVCDAFLNTLEVFPFNSTYAGVLIESTRGFDAQGNLLKGRFDPLFMTEKGYRENGGKLVVVVGSEEILPEGKVAGRITIPETILKATNDLLRENNRVTLPESLSEKTHGAATVVDVEVFPKNVPGNEFFWKRGQIFLNLKTSDGESTVMTFNALGDNKEQGGVNLVVTDDGKFVLMDTVRPLTGAGSKILKEISRGYADVAIKQYKEKLNTLGFPEIDPTQLGMELGLKSADVLESFDPVSLRQDWNYENVTPNYQKIILNRKAVLKVAPSEAQQALEEFEGIFPNMLTPKEIIEHVIGGGLMVDAFSLAILGSEFIKGGEIRINPHFDSEKNFVVLEKRFQAQVGEEALVVPNGPAFESGWSDVAPIQPNTGNARFFYRARFSDSVKALPEGRKYVKVSVTQAVELIKDLKLSTPDTASLFATLLKRGILETDPQKMR